MGVPALARMWVDCEGITLSEISQRKQMLCDLTYMWNLKTPELRHREQTGGFQRQGGCEWYGEGGRKTQTSSYKQSARDELFCTGLVNTAVLCI